ncbi:chloride channel protein [Poseidonocella sp. HB161398]|uniref:chloride channel protein n=1 Tax=Poseidonocella sp. HB161398 TaxID=2320855 RepID=UPI0014868830|nr:chloride channel protein [Poseidonocella sp. HB161398]
MPFAGALWIMMQTLLSHGSGASAGMAGAHARLCSAFGSRAGSLASGRRNDMRLVLACGAGASIAALVQSPVAGTFCAFDLVIAAYSIGNLAPAVITSLAAAGTRALLDPSAVRLEGAALPPGADAFPMLALVTLATAAMAVGVMRACTRVEGLVRGAMPGWLASMLGILARASPAALSSGRQSLFSRDVWLAVARSWR